MISFSLSTFPFLSLAALCLLSFSFNIATPHSCYTYSWSQFWSPLPANSFFSHVSDHWSAYSYSHHMLPLLRFIFILNYIACIRGHLHMGIIAHGCQKRVLDPHVELHAAVSCLKTVLQTKFRSSAKALHALNYWTISPDRTWILNSSASPSTTQLLSTSSLTLKLSFRQTTQETQAFPTSVFDTMEKKSPKAIIHLLSTPCLPLPPDTKAVCSSDSSLNFGEKKSTSRDYVLRQPLHGKKIFLAQKHIP